MNCAIGRPRLRRRAKPVQHHIQRQALSTPRTRPSGTRSPAEPASRGPHLDIEGVPDPEHVPLDRPDPPGLTNGPVSAA